MRFVSTRGGTDPVGLSDAITEGIAADGGLFIPAALPVLSWSDFPRSASLATLGELLIAPFAAGDPLGDDLAAVCREAFSFPAPLVPLERARGDASVLELFHGPTCAFKDFGARFLATALERLHGFPGRRSLGEGSDGRKVTILVATSGDTGGAVAAAFHRRPWVDVVLLYPDGLVSPRQAQQLSCWGDNVRTFAVRGTFDDCQRIVKEAFGDSTLAGTHQLSSANSINVGRLLPQMVYYAAASLATWYREERKANFIVPSGNLGNVTACVWARVAGLPIGDIVLATNENRTVTEFLDTGAWRPRPSVATLASAMDVGNPSNMERLRALFPDELGEQVRARLVTDDQIRATIRQDASDARIHLGPSWRDRGARLSPAPRRSTRRSLGAGGNGASGEVQRDRGAACRGRDPGAAGAGAAVKPAQARRTSGADARRTACASGMSPMMRAWRLGCSARASLPRTHAGWFTVSWYPATYCRARTGPSSSISGWRRLSDRAMPASRPPGRTSSASTSSSGLLPARLRFYGPLPSNLLRVFLKYPSAAVKKVAQSRARFKEESMKKLRLSTVAPRGAGRS